MMVSYGRSSEGGSHDRAKRVVRKWIICSGAIESAALATSHGESEWGQTGEEDPWAKCGQGESKLDLSLTKPRRPETEIEVIRQRNPKEEE